jgi:photosystem II stability/assembly factor-like uncharacterized protein
LTGNGTILHIQSIDLSTPGTITSENSGAPVNLSDAYFSDLNTGWVVGGNGTVITGAGGAWSTQISASPPRLLRSVAFNSGRGVAVGFSGSVLITSNGLNWIEISGGPVNTLNAVSFTSDGLYGWAVGSANSILNIDLSPTGGGAWVPTSGVSGAFNGVFALSDTNVWVVGNGGVIYHYTGGWSLHTTVTGGGNLNGVHFLPNGASGWAVGRKPSNNPGVSQIYNYNSGTNTWTAQSASSFPTSLTLNSVHFVSAANGWAVGTGGTILSTSDGGANWTCRLTSATSGVAPCGSSTGPAITWNSVYFTDLSNGWAVGASGNIYRTVNGGANWTAQASGTSSTLFGARFLDSTHGWIVGANGLILATSNGSSWAPQAMVGTIQSLRSVFFTDPQNGWAVGANGTILHTRTGGNN